MPAPTDPRRQQARTERDLAIAVVLLLVAGGGLAILLTYGTGAAITGVICLISFAVIFLLLFVILKLFERWGQ